MRETLVRVKNNQPRAMSNERVSPQAFLVTASPSVPASSPQRSIRDSITTGVAINAFACTSTADNVPSPISVLPYPVYGGGRRLNIIKFSRRLIL